MDEGETTAAAAALGKGTLGTTAALTGSQNAHETGVAAVISFR